MVPRVRESVNATISIRLAEKEGPLLYEGESAFGGMEIEGDTAILETGSP
jgi:hypothetical protein